MNTRSPSIAIVGLACVYPDAGSPAELWENVLAQRRSFRRIPPERLRIEDYWSADTSIPDRTYSTEAALIAGYEFDRVAFRVVGSTFRAADLAHWLALDVASRALADAGFPGADGLPRETTGVLLGNTLTGEFSRANAMRLRWPYVRRLVESALIKENWPAETRRNFLEQLEGDYKSPFPSVGEETLAGGLSNTIAGRICNHFDLKGGGYTVDGACSSSLLAVSNACSALMAGDLDVALAGGVDLSLDPFELVGFAKTGALAPEEMRVYDRRSAGFWPGEGCGFVTLMRHDDALAQGCRVYAVLRGWGISSDGSGGITRPEPEGQLEAVRRAYRRAGFGIGSVAFFEGHGTGTAVGDATELEVLSRARRENQSDAPAAAIGSIKANIGHTKAAAGIAGLLKAIMAVHKQVLPPSTAVEQPHQQLTGCDSPLRPLQEAEPWPNDSPLRAAVSAMGFGGINVHVVLEGASSQKRSSLSSRERMLSRSYQDAELFLLGAQEHSALLSQVETLLNLAASLSRAELTDLAAQLAKDLKASAIRAAIVASTPAELMERLRKLLGWLRNGKAASASNADGTPHANKEITGSMFQREEGIFLGSKAEPPRIAFLFPGQGSPTNLDGGLWRRRFESVRELYERADLPKEGDSVSTRVMQPAVVTASLAGLKVLEDCGIKASVAIGHSLGEITALHWSGVMDEETLLRIARVRGTAMADLGSPTGGMLAVAAPWQDVQKFLNGDPLAIVGFNSPRQTVVAGEIVALGKLAESAHQHGWQTSALPVSHAFHTPLVAAAVPVLAEQLSRENLAILERPVYSTITGDCLGKDEDLRALLLRQVTSPVRFSTALRALLCQEKAPNVEWREAEQLKVDLMIEVGPGAILAGLSRDTTDVPAMPLDASGRSLKGLLQVIGAAFVLGAPVHASALFADRFTRPFSLEHRPKFFGNPCELAPISDDQTESEATSTSDRNQVKARNGTHEAKSETLSTDASNGTDKPIELIRKLVADRAELPISAVQDDSRMLRDLHLNSITVGQLISEAARRLGLQRILAVTEFANASVAEIAQALAELKHTAAKPGRSVEQREPPGVDAWFESFTTEWVEAPLPRSSALQRNSQLSKASGAGWQIFAGDGHPLAAPLRERLADANGNGILVLVSESRTERDYALLLEAAKTVGALGEQPRFVVVQHGWGGTGFAKTLHLEMPGLVTCVVNVPPACPGAVEWIAQEALSATGFTEVQYDSAGHRREARLKSLPAQFGDHPDGTTPFPIGASDVLLVTGGGKGIAAECALAIGRATGARLALMGRSDPATDKELNNNLSRIAGAGVQYCYVRADVVDGEGVKKAVTEAEQKLGGSISAVLHAAGANQPQLIAGLDMAALRRTFAPKIQGMQNLLAAIDPGRLRLLVTFGSIIARTGFRGEADYAAANEWLTAFTEEFQTNHPQCRCLAVEWSVWSAVGMGERLGRMESLIQQGIIPIPPDRGVQILLNLLQLKSCPPAVVVAGRFGQPPTIKMARPELPLLRFLERSRVYYPGVELIVDAELSIGSDLYLQDHVLQKQKIFPAVLGLEAMAQVAMALTGSELPPSFEKVELPRPITVADDLPAVIRLAALRRGPNLVEVCLRSAETDYHVDHFRALCRFNSANNVPRLTPARIPASRPVLTPGQDLYGRLLFHSGRFQRLSGYQLLAARECIAEIQPSSGAPWYGPYLPAQFVLGDPGARDAALHAIQACVPHRRILPTGIDALTIHRNDSAVRIIRAKERYREGNNFVYDLEVTDDQGELLESWQGLHLRAVEELKFADSWPEPLVAPYLERRIEELVPHSAVHVSLAHNGWRENATADFLQSRAASTNVAIENAVGRPLQVWRRGDGRPVSAHLESFSAAHANDLTLAVAAQSTVACDLELVEARTTDIWRDLIGEQEFRLAERIARENSESTDAAATRLWSAAECIKKAGLATGAPVVLASCSADGWVLFRAGSLMIASCLSAMRGIEPPLVFSIAVRANSSGYLSEAAEKVVA